MNNEDRAEKYISPIHAISGSGGHGSTFNVASILVNGFKLARDQSLAIMGRWNETNTGGEKWTEKELAHKVDSAIKAGPGTKPDGWLVGADEWEPRPGQTYREARSDRITIIRPKAKPKPDPLNDLVIAEPEPKDFPIVADDDETEAAAIIIDRAIEIFDADFDLEWEAEKPQPSFR